MSRKFPEVTLTMVGEAVNVSWSDDFDDNNYKSCFARSVAVNSQYKQIRTIDVHQMQSEGKDSSQQSFKRLSSGALTHAIEPIEVKLRKKNRTTCEDDTRRLSCSSVSSSRRTSITSKIPVESIFQQSKVATLQWQLREVEKSREMYKAVMKQVVTFLERAHRNLELLGNNLNSKRTVSRSKSEHQIVLGENGGNSLNGEEDYTLFRDFTWRRTKKLELSDEISPEKLSQEAFRLLRTAQSLLNTQEPKLAPVNDDINDLEFLGQLAKEFPQTPEKKPQRTPSFSLSPKLLTPEKEGHLSMEFNRKLSLQLNETRKASCRLTNFKANFLDVVGDSTFMKPKFKHESEKSRSPPAGSISSVEDESGFSSMNSFQDVGVPLVGDEVTLKNALLRSMLHNNDGNVKTDENPRKHDNIEHDVKLWQKPDNTTHKRWNSTPVHSCSNKQSVNVLWV